MSNKHIQSQDINENVDESFYESDEFFKAMTTVQDFLREIIVANKSIKNSSVKEIINKIKALFESVSTNDTKLSAIINIFVVLAKNIDIQYTDKSGNEIEIMSKVYVFLTKLYKGKQKLIMRAFENYIVTKDYENEIYISYIDTIIVNLQNTKSITKSPDRVDEFPGSSSYVLTTPSSKLSSKLSS